VPGIWTSLISHPSISWPIDGVFRAVVCHGVACSGGVDGFVTPRARFRGASHRQSLSPMGSLAQPEPARPRGHRASEWIRARVMSQLSKVKHSRNQWKHKAKQRGDRDRDQRQQLARISAERDRATKALKAALTRLRQLEAPMQRLVTLPQV